MAIPSKRFEFIDDENKIVITDFNNVTSNAIYNFPHVEADSFEEFFRQLANRNDDDEEVVPVIPPDPPVDPEILPYISLEALYQFFNMELNNFPVAYFSPVFDGSASRDRVAETIVRGLFPVGGLDSGDPVDEAEFTAKHSHKIEILKYLIPAFPSAPVPLDLNSPNLMHYTITMSSLHSNYNAEFKAFVISNGEIITYQILFHVWRPIIAAGYSYGFYGLLNHMLTELPVAGQLYVDISYYTLKEYGHDSLTMLDIASATNISLLGALFVPLGPEVMVKFTLPPRLKLADYMDYYDMVDKAMQRLKIKNTFFDESPDFTLLQATALVQKMESFGQQSQQLLPDSAYAMLL